MSSSQVQTQHQGDLSQQAQRVFKGNFQNWLAVISYGGANSNLESAIQDICNELGSRYSGLNITCSKDTSLENRIELCLRRDNKEIRKESWQSNEFLLGPDKVRVEIEEILSHEITKCKEGAESIGQQQHAQDQGALQKNLEQPEKIQLEKDFHGKKAGEGIDQETMEKIQKFNEQDQEEGFEQQDLGKETKFTGHDTRHLGREKLSFEGQEPGFTQKYLAHQKQQQEKEDIARQDQPEECTQETLQKQKDFKEQSQEYRFKQENLAQQSQQQGFRKENLGQDQQQDQAILSQQDQPKKLSEHSKEFEFKQENQGQPNLEDIPLNKLLKTQEGLKKLQEAEEYQGQSASEKKEEPVIGGSHEQQEILGQKHYGSLEKTL